MTEHVEVSLFPIPNSISLPLSTVPLHVFEPRYRKMIADSLEQKRRIGIAHTKRVIKPSKMDAFASPAEFLRSNQATYEAFPIFCAGFAEIIETLPDGRLVVQIKMDNRYEIIDEIQQIPYKIVRCRLFEDQDKSDQKALQESSLLREIIDETLLKLDAAGLETLKQHIQSEEWQSTSLLDYSFLVYSLVLFKPDVLQKVIEMKSIRQRLDFLLTSLSQKKIH